MGFPKTNEHGLKQFLLVMTYNFYKIQNQRSIEFKEIKKDRLKLKRKLYK